jgi:hypothetical protein
MTAPNYDSELDKATSAAPLDSNAQAAAAPSQEGRPIAENEPSGGATEGSPPTRSTLKP